MNAPLKTPGPDHPITIAPVSGHVRVVWRGYAVAETDKALALKETTYPLVYYIPREDADMAFFERSARVTHCPYKGDANYFSLIGEGQYDEAAVWTYETPGEAVKAIGGHLAFYADKVTFEVA